MKLIQSIFILMMVGWGMMLTAASTPQIDPKTLDVLHKVESKINSSDYLSYHVVQENSQEDSEKPPVIYEATIWSVRVPDEPLHGAHFHVSGKNPRGETEYFFDGEAGYEIQDKEQKVLVFPIRDFPMDQGHPALCAPSAVMFYFTRLVRDTDFVKTILENHASVSMQENPEGKDWIITFDYKEDRFGHKTRTLHIDKESSRIMRVYTRSDWRGVVSLNDMRYTDYESQQTAVEPHIAMPKDVRAGYSREIYVRRKAGKPAVLELIGKPAPDFTASTISGKDISLKQFRGKLVLLDFWEFWCAPCRLAMPHTNALQQKWKDGLVVIGIVTENEKEVRKAIEHEKLTYINVMADKKLLKTYKVNGWPNYYLIGRDGKLLDAGTGNNDRIVAKIEELLSKEDTDTPQPATDHVE